MAAATARYGCRLAAQTGVTDGASYRRATPDREPASRRVLARGEILDGFGGQRLATDAPF
jgi:hypothetical protein